MKRSVKSLLYLIGIIATPILLYVNQQAYSTEVGYWAFNSGYDSSEYCLPASPLYYDPKAPSPMIFAWAKTKACEDLGLVGEAAPSIPSDFDYIYKGPTGVKITFDHNDEERLYIERPFVRPVWHDLVVFYDKADGTRQMLDLYPEKTFPGNGLIGALMGILVFLSICLIILSPCLLCIGVCTWCSSSSKRPQYEIANEEQEENEV